MFSRVEIKVVVFLALLLWGISHEMEGERDPSISEEEDLELERELRRRNKPAIKSFQLENGVIIDCIDINKQPALDHPLLKNHKIQLKPSTASPFGFWPETSSQIQSSRIGLPMQSSTTALPDGGCPEGTVPIIRLTKRDLIWEKNPPKKYYPMDPKSPGFNKATFIHQSLPIPSDKTDPN